MAAPNYNRWGAAPAQRPAERPAKRPPSRRTSPGRQSPADRRKAALRRRSFISLVVVPIVLMVGSVYLHTVSGAGNERAAELQESIQSAGTEKESLDVRVAELSGLARVGTLAERDLLMRDPDAEDLRVYSNEEDGRTGAGRRQEEGNR